MKVENNEADPGIETRTDSTYEDRGLPVRELIDSDGNGVFDGLHRWHFDDHGNVETVTLDDLVDGTVDSVRSFFYEDGRLIDRMEEDADGNGSVDRVITFRHDAADRLIERTAREQPSGSLKYSFFYEYDDRGQLVEERYTDSDGQLSITRYRWDGNLLVRLDADFDNDGAADYTETYEYDPRGLLVKLIDEFDASGDGTKWHTFRYNQMGLVVRAEDVELGAGVVGWTDEVYDLVGRPLRRLSAHLGLPSTEWTFRNECPAGSVTYLPLVSR